MSKGEESDNSVGNREGLGMEGSEMRDHRRCDGTKSKDSRVPSLIVPGND